MTKTERAHELVHTLSDVELGQEIPEYYEKVRMVRIAFADQQRIDHEKLCERMCDWYCNHCEVQKDCTGECNDIINIKHQFAI